MKKISIIIPVYFNEANLLPLYNDLKENVLNKLTCDYEIVMVDDGSTDRSYEVICELAKIDSKIKPVKLSRNFGSHAAILAGLSVCTGDCAAMKAADLQEPSELILDMLEKYNEGNNVVLAVRSDREESFSQKAFASVYYWMVRKSALPNMPKGGFDCFLIDRQVIDTLVALHEKNTSLMGQIIWSGYKTATVYYVRKKREIGKSRWTLRKKLKLVSDSLYGFSYLPIKLISGVGVVSLIGSIVWLLVIFISKLLNKISIPGYTTLSIILLLSFGITMFSIGVIGEYIWRMFDATRNRPPFIIEHEQLESQNQDDVDIKSQ